MTDPRLSTCLISPHLKIIQPQRLAAHSLDARVSNLLSGYYWLISHTISLHFTTNGNSQTDIPLKVEVRMIDLEHH